MKKMQILVKVLEREKKKFWKYIKKKNTENVKLLNTHTCFYFYFYFLILHDILQKKLLNTLLCSVYVCVFRIPDKRF